MSGGLVGWWRGQVAGLSQDESPLLGRSTCHGDNFSGGVETTILYGASTSPATSPAGPHDPRCPWATSYPTRG